MYDNTTLKSVPDIRWWGSSSGALCNEDYLFIVIIPQSTLTNGGCTC